MRKIIGLTVCIILMVWGVSSSQDANKGADMLKTEQGTVTGIVRLIGNSPFEELIITGTSDIKSDSAERRNYYVTGKLSEDLKKYAYNNVKAKGTIEKRALKLAADSGTIERYFIEVTQYHIVDK